MNGNLKMSWLYAPLRCTTESDKHFWKPVLPADCDDVIYHRFLCPHIWVDVHGSPMLKASASFKLGHFILIIYLSNVHIDWLFFPSFL